MATGVYLRAALRNLWRHIGQVSSRCLQIFRRKRKRCKVCGRRLWAWERHGLCRREAVPTPLVVIKAPK
jgi:hypothetical protein